MDTPVSIDHPALPFTLKRIMRRFNKPLQDEFLRRAVQRLEELGSEPFTYEDYVHCLGQAHIVVLGGKVKRAEPQPDPSSMQRALDDYDAGRSRPLKDYVNELRCRVSSGG